MTVANDQAPPTKKVKKQETSRSTNKVQDADGLQKTSTRSEEQPGNLDLSELTETGTSFLMRPFETPSDCEM